MVVLGHRWVANLQHSGRSFVNRKVCSYAYRCVPAPHSRLLPFLPVGLRRWACLLSLRKRFCTTAPNSNCKNSKFSRTVMLLGLLSPGPCYELHRFQFIYQVKVSYNSKKQRVLSLFVTLNCVVAHHAGQLINSKKRNFLHLVPWFDRDRFAGISTLPTRQTSTRIPSFYLMVLRPFSRRIRLRPRG